MSLLDRLTGVEEPKLPVHQFWASIAEWGDAYVTRADVLAAYGISAAEESELDFIRVRWSASVDKPAFEHELHRVLLLSEGRLHGYDVKSVITARISQIP